MKDLVHTDYYFRSAWTDYRQITKDKLLPVTVDSQSFLQRVEFRNLYYHCAGYSTRQMSTIFRTSIRSIEQVLRRAQRKYNQSPTTKKFFTTPFANQAQQAEEKNFPVPAGRNASETSSKLSELPAVLLREKGLKY